MTQLSNPRRISFGWLGPAPLATLVVLSLAANPQTQTQAHVPARPVLGPPIPPDPIKLALSEAPPANPPAAPSQESGCGAGPRGISSVYLNSGEFYLRQVDLVIPGRGLDFVWARTYRSRIGPDTEQGYGWDFSYNLGIAFDGTAVRVNDGSGRSDLYLPQIDGTYGADGFFRSGAFNTDGTFTLLFSDRGDWTFFALDGSPLAGKVKTISDRNGNTLGFDYDGLGRLNLVVDTLGRQISIAHDLAGRIASVTDFTGRQVVYAYYGSGESGGGPGDLRSARSPIVVGTPNGNNFPFGKRTIYTYSQGFANERLNHNLLTVTDPKGQTSLINEYAAQKNPQHLLFDRLTRQTRGDPGDVVDVTYAVSTSTLPLTAIVNDAVGNVSEYVYDIKGRCRIKRDFTGRADPDQPTTAATNRPVGPLRPTDPAYFQTRWSYNADSRATKVIHPNGNVTHNVYELALDPLASRRSRGNLRERHLTPGAHTPVGNQTTLTELFEYDADFGGCCGSNFVARHTDARGNVTEHDYDASGNRTQTRHRIPSIVEDFIYNVFGQVTSHTHPDNGSGWRQMDTWAYYPPASGPQEGYLQSESIDAGGFNITNSWVYDAVGNAVQVTDARGNVTNMDVNSLNQVVRQTSPPVHMLNGNTAKYRIDTWYDANDNVVRVDTANRDDEGHLALNPALTTLYEYETLNRESRVTEEVDVGQDVVTEYEYDANRNRTLVRYGAATSGAQPTNVERFHYDERDLLFRKVRAEGDANQSTDQFDYDSNGQRVRAVRGLECPAPRVHLWTVDAYGRGVVETDAMGNVTYSDYDPNGNVEHVRIDGELCDAPGSAGNVRLFEANYCYDAMDRRTKSMELHFDPATQLAIGDGVAMTLWAFTDHSEPAAITDDNGNVTTMAYDTAGRKMLVVDAKGNSLQTLYDPNHNVLQTVETEKPDTGGPDQVFISTHLYDELDREVLAQDSVANEIQMGYDSRDNMTRHVDALGNTTLNAYDGLDRLITSTRILTDDGTGGGTATGQIQRSWSWDDSRRLVGQIDDNDNLTAYSYDALGRRDRVYLADGKVEAFVYDQHGNVVQRVDPNGTLVTSTYDLANRVSGRAIAPGAGVSADTTFEVWKHDGLGRIVHAEDDDSVVNRMWDSLSNQTSETQNGKTFACTHDGMRNELTLTYPSGKVVSCTYDALNRMKTVDSLGDVATYDYVGPARVERRYGGGGLQPLRLSKFGYDGARRTATVEHLLGTTTIDDRAFEWDAAYNRTEATDNLSGAERDYTYDSQYRLVRSLETLGASIASDVQFAFDGVGNRTSVAGGACPGAYVMDSTAPEPADHQMNQYTNTPCIGCIEYDANGNQVKRGASEGLTYDYGNRLAIHKGVGNTTSFAYDALGRNIAKVGATPPESRSYYYHGFDVLEERDGNDAVVSTYVRGRLASGYDNPWAHLSFNPQPEPPILHEILAVDRAGRSFFYADDLGSTRVVTTLTAVTERYDYDEAGLPSFFDATGSPLAGTAIGNDRLFTGQRWDAETSYYAFYARHMDPLLGQFLSRDPIGIWGDAVNIGNGRTYVANNFQTLVDPTGMYSKACGGPWPGPKTVFYGYVDCGSNYDIPDALCGAMRGAGRARRDVKTWVSYELTGYPGGGIWLGGVPFRQWFGGSNQSISFWQRFQIADTLRKVWDPFRKGKANWIECESSCDAGITAYVPWYDSNLHLCPLWSQFAPKRRASILLHELSHELAGTEDHFYHAVQTQPSPGYSTSILATNADTYEGMYLKYFVQ